jgi:4-diphosphocytidyl-2-C-methyl-D-erythritol kinase
VGVRVIVEHAPAKLNAFLHIVGKRADGYHLLDSVVFFTEFGDTVRVKEADEWGFECIGPYAAALVDTPPEANLVMKAAHALAHHAKIDSKAYITLEKHIPVGAGIGGGSADAAATLRALCKLWQLHIPHAELLTIAVGIGADVPVCLEARTAWMRGIGELVTPVAVPFPYHVLLVNPNIPLPTPCVFAAYVGQHRAPLPLSDEPSWEELLGATHNDLEGAAIECVPQVAEVLHWLRTYTRPVVARMSGSGATCFALYTNERDALQAQQQLSKEQPHWWSVATTVR